MVGPPLWKIWKSIGMMRFPIYGKIKNVPNHQPVFCSCLPLTTFLNRVTSLFSCDASRFLAGRSICVFYVHLMSPPTKTEKHASFWEVVNLDCDFFGGMLFICIYKYVCTYIYIHTLHYITLHYITFHSIPLHYITLHYITLHYITLHYIQQIL